MIKKRLSSPQKKIMIKSSHFNYWGKTKKEQDSFHLLPYHNLDVAAVGHVILDSSPLLLNFYQNQFGFNTPVQAKQFLLFLISIHDIGKYSDAFQQLVPDIAETLERNSKNRSYSIRHDALGLYLWEYYLAQLCLEDNVLNIKNINDADNDIDLTDTFKPLFGPIFGHHGQPSLMKSMINKLEYRHHFSDGNIKDAESYFKDVGKLFLSVLEPMVFNLNSTILSDTAKNASWWLAGFISLCDWIGSDSDYFHYQSEVMSLENYWKKLAIPAARKAVEVSGLKLNPNSPPSLHFKQLFPSIARPSPLQHIVSEMPIPNGPQLFILEDSTGSGKSEAALILAHRMIREGLGDSVFFGLPTMATSNAMYQRIVPLYHRFFSDDFNPSLVLAHSANRMHDDYLSSISNKTFSPKDDISNSSYCSEWMSDNRKKALLAPFGVGTIDQALMAVLTCKYQSLRLFGLLNKILILDEIHASDAYVHKLTLQLLECHAQMGGSAILLSATLPEQMKRELLATYNHSVDKYDFSANKDIYPLISQSNSRSIKETPSDSSPRSYKTIRWSLHSDKDMLLKRLQKTLSFGRCAAWICNTVTEAIDLFLHVRHHFTDINAALFHARYALGDRLEIGDDILDCFGPQSGQSTRQGRLVIATQVIEQSMDLDFDFMVTDLCPIDLIIQRMGRLRRHARNAKGDRLTSSKDERGIPELWVHSPAVPSSEDCQKDWFTSFSKPSASIYKDHQALWLTAKYINMNPEFHVPSDLRAAISAVFDDDAKWSAPKTLEDSAMDHDVNNMCKSQMADYNTITLNSAYYFSEVDWSKDIYAPTRMADKLSIRVRLCILSKEEDLLPMYKASDPQKSWELSDVSVPEYFIKDGLQYAKEITSAITALTESWPGKADWYKMIVFVKDDSADEYVCKAGAVSLIYNRDTGLRYGSKV